MWFAAVGIGDCKMRLQWHVGYHTSCVCVFVGGQRCRREAWIGSIYFLLEFTPEIMLGQRAPVAPDSIKCLIQFYNIFLFDIKGFTKRLWNYLYKKGVSERTTHTNAIKPSDLLSLLSCKFPVHLFSTSPTYIGFRSCSACVYYNPHTSVQLSSCWLSMRIKYTIGYPQLTSIVLIEGSLSHM